MPTRSARCRPPGLSCATAKGVFRSRGRLQLRVGTCRSARRPLTTSRRMAQRSSTHERPSNSPKVWSNSSVQRPSTALLYGVRGLRARTSRQVLSMTTVAGITRATSSEKLLRPSGGRRTTPIRRRPAKCRAWRSYTCCSCWTAAASARCSAQARRAADQKKSCVRCHNCEASSLGCGSQAAAKSALCSSRPHIPKVVHRVTAAVVRQMSRSWKHKSGLRTPISASPSLHLSICSIATLASAALEDI
mmetsp:Transcript_133208/g.371337  ORF Transcript_133208/g.371337 Transcript_133208/m.371337 type:complete len:247 (-) Transcript_133208:140-880(-)